MNINPWNKEMYVIEVTGQQLVDALEHGVRSYPEYSGGFLQVSGVTFDVNAWTESPVITDSLGNFIGIDSNAERRVANVKIGGEPVDLAKKYTLASSEYVLIQGGDGLTMFAGSKIVSAEDLPCDSEMLVQYFTQILGGKITAEQYGNPNAGGRIKIIEVEPDVPGTPDKPTYEACDHLCHKGGFMGFIWKIVKFFSKLFKINPVCDCGAAHY